MKPSHHGRELQLQKKAADGRHFCRCCIKGLPRGRVLHFVLNILPAVDAGKLDGCDHDTQNAKNDQKGNHCFTPPIFEELFSSANEDASSKMRLTPRTNENSSANHATKISKVGKAARMLSEYPLHVVESDPGGVRAPSHSRASLRFHYFIFSERKMLQSFVISQKKWVRRSDKLSPCHERDAAGK